MKKLFRLFAVLVTVFFWQSMANVAQAAPLSMLEIEGKFHTQEDLLTNPYGSGWSYDRDSNTVTLNNYNSSYVYGGSTGSNDLVIKLKGNNTITLNTTATNNESAIYSTGNTRITADDSNASLTVTATGPRGNTPLIGAGDTLIIDNGNIQISHTYGNTTPDDAMTSLLKANNVEIIGNAKITATGEANTSYSAGIGPSRSGGSLKIATARDVSIKMTAVEPVNANNIYAIYNNNLSDKAQFGGSGTYTFEAPSRALNIRSSLIDGQIITMPMGAYFDGSSMYDANGNIVTPAKVVIGQGTSHRLTVYCGSGGICTPNTGDYLENNAMAYTFTANSGYVLDHFEITPHGVNSSYSGAPSVSGAFNFNQDTTIRVNFKAKNSNTDYAITAKSNAGGTISAPSKSKANQTVNVTAEPNAGYRLVSVQWYKTHEPATKHDITEAKSFTMPDAAVVVEAEFFPLPQYVINITCESNGICTKTPDLPLYYPGDTVTVKFVANPGYVIENILMNGSPVSDSINQTSRSVTLNNLNSGHTFKATFKPAPSFTVSINETENGSIAADKTTAKIGETVTLTVTPAEGFRLKADTLKVMKGSVRVPVVDNAFIMPDGNVTVSAIFEGIPLYDAMFMQCDPNKGDCSMDPSKPFYYEGETVNVQVVPKDGFEIDKITINTQGQTLNSRLRWTYTTTVTKNTYFGAHFRERVQYTVHSASSANGTITADKTTAVEGKR